MARDNEENNKTYNEQKERAQELRDSAARDRKWHDEISDTLTKSRQSAASGSIRSSSTGRGNTGSGTGNGCFPAGTNVATPDGTCDIARLLQGDMVLAVDMRTGQMKRREILKIVVHDANRIWALRFSDGSSVRTTAVHSFLVAGKWMKASRIQIGDTLAVPSPNGLNEKTVIASEATGSVEPVYNLIVDGDFNFIADSVLAHSFTYLRALKVAIWSHVHRWRYARKSADLAFVRCSSPDGKRPTCPDAGRGL